MILLRILTKDFIKKKGIMLIVFTFIMLSAFLMSVGSNLIVELNNSLDALFSAARVPHYVQMHAGSLDPQKIEQWAEGNPLVEEYQLVEMITMDGSALAFEASDTSEENSVMDISFVRQNTKFDYLLDMNNQPLQVDRGEIGVPIYYLQNRNIET